MPKLSVEVPEALRPYYFHKLDLNYNAPGSQATGDCPFCGGSKFFVGKENGVYSCKTCDAGYPSGPNGNSYNFIRKLYQESSAKLSDLELVSAERKISIAALQRGGLVQSLIDHEWMLPGYGLKGEVNNLYRWSITKESDGTYKRRVKGTTSMAHCLFGVEHWDDVKPDVWLLEGPWDEMRVDDEFSKEEELSSSTNIVGAPGCETFKDEWVEKFRGKNCFIPFDNDHKKVRCKCKKTYNPLLRDTCPKCGSTEVVDHNVLGAGYTGMRSVARKLKPVAASIHILNWGELGFDSRLPDGFDVRDYLNTTLALKG